MNVKPKNYEWVDFFDKMISLHEHSFSKKAIYRRYKVNKGLIPKAMNIVRATSSEGWGKIRYFYDVRKRLDEDMSFRRFYEQETDEIPPFLVNQIKNAMGPLWEWLPENGVTHDSYSYMKWDRQKATA